jgi:hypothetical protein
VHITRPPHNRDHLVQVVDNIVLLPLDGDVPSAEMSLGREGRYECRRSILDRIGNRKLGSVAIASDWSPNIAALVYKVYPM